MRELPLRPYPGKVIVCKTRGEYSRTHKRLWKEDACDLSSKNGRMDARWSEKTGGIYLVWAVDQARMAHELSHVILHVFEMCGIDPREANGEPFCYMLSQLMLEAR